MAVKRTDSNYSGRDFTLSSGMNLTVESLINDSNHQFLYLLKRVNFKKPMEEWPKNTLGQNYLRKSLTASLDWRDANSVGDKKN